MACSTSGITTKRANAHHERDVQGDGFHQPEAAFEFFGLLRQWRAFRFGWNAGDGTQRR